MNFFNYYLKKNKTCWILYKYYIFRYFSEFYINFQKIFICIFKMNKLRFFIFMTFTPWFLKNLTDSADYFNINSIIMIYFNTINKLKHSNFKYDDFRCYESKQKFRQKMNQNWIYYQKNNMIDSYFWITYFLFYVIYPLNLNPWKRKTTKKKKNKHTQKTTKINTLITSFN